MSHDKLEVFWGGLVDGVETTESVFVRFKLLELTAYISLSVFRLKIEKIASDRSDEALPPCFQ